MTRLEEARQRFADSQDELKAAELEHARKFDVGIVGDDQSLDIRTDADEVYMMTGNGCDIVINGDIGIVTLKIGDGSSVTFEKNVGCANVCQGNGGYAIFEKPDHFNLKQGAGSEAHSVSPVGLGRLAC